MENRNAKEPIRITPELLRGIRKRVLDATQIQMAQMLAISYSYYRMLEKGTYPITPENEVRIKTALGLSPAKLRHVRQIVEGNPLGDE